MKTIFQTTSKKKRKKKSKINPSKRVLGFLSLSPASCFCACVRVRVCVDWLVWFPFFFAIELCHHAQRTSSHFVRALLIKLAPSCLFTRTFYKGNFCSAAAADNGAVPNNLAEGRREESCVVMQWWIPHAVCVCDSSITCYTTVQCFWSENWFCGNVEDFSHFLCVPKKKPQRNKKKWNKRFRL